MQGPGSTGPEVHQITNAVTPLSDDLDARMAKYLISMLVRTACVVLVLVVDGWLRWVFAVGAVCLPYVAVIVANNSGGRRRGKASLGTPDMKVAALDGGAPPVLLTGVVHPRRDDAAPAPDTAPDTGAGPLRDTA